MGTSWLCVSMRFLDTTFHGRRDGSEPNWPPSPMRAFQALVATAGRLDPTGFSEATQAALGWLEQQPAPLIVAPMASTTIGRRLSVPNNAMDVVARAWSRGNDSDQGDADPRTHRTMKTVRPMWLRGDCVSFVWGLPAESVEVASHAAILKRLARRVSSLWGVDLVVGDACVIGDSQLAAIEGERWSSKGTNRITVSAFRCKALCWNWLLPPQGLHGAGRRRGLHRAAPNLSVRGRRLSPRYRSSTATLRCVVVASTGCRGTPCVRSRSQGAGHDAARGEDRRAERRLGWDELREVCSGTAKNRARNTLRPDTSRIYRSPVLSPAAITVASSAEFVA